MVPPALLHFGLAEFFSVFTRHKGEKSAAKSAVNDRFGLVFRCVMRYLGDGWKVHLQRSLFNWHNTASLLRLNKNGQGRWQKKKAHYLCGPQSRGGAWPSPVKAPGLGPGDRRFESCRPDYKSRSHCERLFLCARAKACFHAG